MFNPRWMFHATFAARIITSQEELQSLGDGWADSPQAAEFLAGDRESEAEVRAAAIAAEQQAAVERAQREALELKALEEQRITAANAAANEYAAAEAEAKRQEAAGATSAVPTEVVAPAQVENAPEVKPAASEADHTNDIAAQIAAVLAKGGKK
jgi:hypothetical protein